MARFSKAPFTAAMEAARRPLDAIRGTRGRGNAGARAGSPTTSLGTSGAVVYSGFLQENERNPLLTGQQRYRTFSDILANVAIVAAGCRYYLNLVSKAGWRVEPPEGSGAEGRRLADLIENILDDMETPWHRVVRRTAMFKYHGFSVQEWTAKRRPDGVIGFEDIEARPQVTIYRWDLDQQGDVLGMVQLVPQNGNEVYLPREKVVYAVDDALNDTPEGLGLFRHIAETSIRLRKFELLEAYGYETDLRGIPVGRAPSALLNKQVEQGSLSPEARDSAINEMKDFIERHIKTPALGMLLDSIPYSGQDEAQTPSAQMQWGLDLLKGNSAMSSEAVAKAISRLNREIARVLGVEFLLLGEDGMGSNALSRDKTTQFGLMVDSALKEVEETYEDDVVGTLFKLNGWNPELKPTLKTESVQFRDIEQITAALRNMAVAGAPMLMDDPAVNAVRDLLGLPKIDLTQAALSVGVQPPTATDDKDPATGPDDDDAAPDDDAEGDG